MVFIFSRKDPTNKRTLKTNAFCHPKKAIQFYV